MGVSGRESMTKVRKAVFPVAGLGTRFLPATKAIPKEMLPVVDRPVIDYVVEEAREAGIEHFIFVTGRNKGVIEDHFDVQVELYDTLAQRGKDHVLGDLQRMQPAPGQTSFTRQQKPLGLGHAVWCAREIVGNEPFALLLPDMIMQSDPGCLSQMVTLYEKTGGNVVAVQECDPAETHKYGIVGRGRAVALDVVVDEGVLAATHRVDERGDLLLLGHLVAELLGLDPAGFLGGIEDPWVGSAAGHEDHRPADGDEARRACRHAGRAPPAGGRGSAATEHPLLG